MKLLLACVHYYFAVFFVSIVSTITLAYIMLDDLASLYYELIQKLIKSSLILMTISKSPDGKDFIACGTYCFFVMVFSYSMQDTVSENFLG